MISCSPVSTPIITNHHLSQTQSPNNQYKLKKYLEYAKGIHFISLVGLLWYVTQTCPDIQFAVGLVAQFAGNPGILHLSASKRILHYLKGTKNLSLQLGGTKNKKLTLVGWSDSSWAGDLDNRKSMSGWCFNINGSTVSWSSKKQSMVATLTVKAEYIASSNATWEAIWL